MCFILDTGSTCSLIDSSVIKYFKDIVEPVGEYFVNGIDETKHKVDIIVIPLIIEGQIYKQKFCVSSLLEAFRDVEMKMEYKFMVYLELFFYMRINVLLILKKRIL